MFELEIVKLNFKVYEKFVKKVINVRKILYKKLFSMIWNIENLNER